MKTILVPTDFSTNALFALNYAVEFAKVEHAKIILLHAYHVDYTVAYVPVNIIESEKKEAGKKTEAHLKKLCTSIIHTDKVPCEFISTEDLAVDAILKAVKEKKIDFIIMGTKGAGKLEGIILGSLTTKVIEKATCPVIAVPEGTTYRAIKKITYASDYHHSDMGALESVVAIAKPYKAQLNVLHIAQETHLSDEEKQKMKQFMDEVQKNISYNNLSFQVLQGENTEQKLDEYLENESTDLLVMSTHKRNLLDKLFGKSITKQLAFHVKVPLMAFHYKMKESTMLF